MPRLVTHPLTWRSNDQNYDAPTRAVKLAGRSQQPSCDPYLGALAAPKASWQFLRPQDGPGNERPTTRSWFLRSLSLLGRLTLELSPNPSLPIPTTPVATNCDANGLGKARVQTSGLEQDASTAGPLELRVQG